MKKCSPQKEISKIIDARSAIVKCACMFVLNCEWEEALRSRFDCFLGNAVAELFYCIFLWRFIVHSGQDGVLID